MRKAVVIFGAIALTALAIISSKNRAHTSLAFRIARMDFSQKRPLAFIVVSNEGTTAAKWGFGGGWIDVQTRDGLVTSDLHFCGIMEPGTEEVLPIYLPAEAQHWWIRCVVSEANTRELVSFKLRKHWDGKIRWLGRKLLAGGQGPQQTVNSPVFNAENFVEGHP
jgi:hypothetical protein